MYYSKYNLVFNFDDQNNEKYAIMNSLSGSFDLATEDEMMKLYQLRDKGQNIDDPKLATYLLDRGYIFNEQAEEDQLVQVKYNEFSAITTETSKQLILIPTYACNLACTYCFQHGVEGRPNLITKEIVDAFFAYANKTFALELNKPFVTLFGGEPLIYSKAQAEIISYIVDQCNQNGYQLAVVTNGYNLEEYLDILKKANIREIQVTVDGPQVVHDARRAMANGKGTFTKIMAGLEKAIAAGMPINFRSVVDQSNLTALIMLAEYIDSKGWLDLPAELFKTQIGRNYELFECYARPEHLLNQVELWAEVARLSKEVPVLRKFHQPEFKGLKQLVQTGEMYLASFDTCPAAKTEWVFDLYGEIYGCTATCGRAEYKLGTYYPTVQLDNNSISTWQNRNVQTIPECRDCAESLICGGGCGVVACNQNGSIKSPDCRPVKQLLDIGINYYKEEILNL